VLQDIGKNDPETAEKIRKILVTMEDISNLSKEQLYELYKLVGARILALGLKNVEPEIKEYLMKNLSSGAQDILIQEMQLIPAVVPAPRMTQAKKEVIKAIKQVMTIKHPA